MWCPNQQVHNFDEEFGVADVLLSNCEEKVAVALGRSVRIHDKVSLQQTLQLNFESEINALTWTDEGSGRFLLVAEHSGLLHTVHTRSDRVVNSERVSEAKDDVDRTVRQLHFVEQTNTLFILACGVLHCYTHMDYSALDTALTEGSMAKAMALRKQIAHTCTTVSAAVSSVVSDEECMSVYLLGDESCLLTKLGYSDTIWTVEGEATLHGYGSIVAAFRVTPLYLLTLTDKGTLILWNLLTCTAVRIWSDHKVLKVGRMTAVSNSIHECRVLAYTQLYGRESYSLAILSLPSCEVLYSQPATSYIALALDYTVQLSVPYVCGDNSTPSLLTSIELISAQARCDMLVSKHQYSEALTFAKSHQLDTQRVYEAWAQCISPTLFQQGQSAASFISRLDMLTDVHKVADICLSSISASGRVDDSRSLKAIIESVLEYALKRLGVADHAKCACDRTTKLLVALQRFTTFTLAYPSEAMTLDGWHAFLTCELQQEILKIAKSQSPSAAMIVWCRHKCEIQRCMTVQWLDELLECISTALDYRAVCAWLRDHMVPVIDKLEQVSFSQLLTKHLQRLVTDYELSQKEFWPQNSLALCSLLDKFESALLSPSLTRLKLMRDNLQAILELKQKYHCSLSYAQYCEQTEKSMVHRLLDVVAVPSMFRHHYDTVAVRYMTQHCIHTDKTLLLYVKDLISRYKYQRGYDTAGLLWEQKAVQVVDCINIASYRVRATIELAKHCHSPWSKCVADLVHSSCLLHHEDVQELESIRKRSILSHLLTSYDIPKEVVPNSTNVQMILKYILKYSKASLSGVLHALQVGEALQVEKETVYLLACQTRLRNGDEITDILEAVPECIVKQVKTRIVSQCIEILNQPEGVDWAIKSHWAQTAIVVLSAKWQHVDDKYFHVSQTQLHSQLKALLLLKKEFNMEMTLTALDTREKMAHLLQLVNSAVVHTSSVESEESEDDLAVVTVKSISDCMWSLETFSQLCSISKRDLYQSIYIVARDIIPQSAVPILQLVANRDKTGEAVKFITEKIAELIEASECHVRNAKQLLALSQTCTALCEEDDLLQVTTQHNLLCYHHNVMINCLGGDDQQDVTSLEADNAELDTLFARKHHRETDLMVNTALVGELTNHWMQSVTDLRFRGQGKTRKCIDSYDRYHQLLRSNNHDLLGVRMTLHLYFSSTCLPASDTQLTNYLSSQLKLSLSTLLPKLLSHRNLDVQLILAALLDMSPGVALSLARKSIASYGSQFLRIMSLSNVALVICEQCKQAEFREKCLALKHESIWGHILAKYGVKYLSAFGKPNKGDLLPQIACKCPLEVIDTYISCNSLGCDTDRTYLVRVQNLVERHCETEFWSESKEGMGILDEISTLLAGVTLSEQLIDSLVDECNPYNYSLIQALLSASPQPTNKKQQLLNLLMLYKRQEVPSTWEINYWREMYAGKGDNSLPEISNTRLPYHPLLSANVWKVLCTELSSRTFQVLQPIVSLLEIKTDVYLLNTALQIAESHIGNLSHSSAIATEVSAANWSTDDVVDSKFVDDIMTVLAAIQDKRCTVMCALSLTDKLPCGTEKVLVCKICIDLALSWRQACPQASEEYRSADAVLKKVTTEHCRLSIEQCLYQHGLGSQYFIDLIVHPTQLIQAILETTHIDSSLSAGEKFNACHCIAELAGKDIARVCFDIVNDCWLCVGSAAVQASIDMDMTMALDMGDMLSAAEQSTNEMADSDSRDKEKWIVHLANSGIGLKIVHLLNSILTRVSSPTKTKLLVIRCFLLLGDTSLACLSTDDSPTCYIQLTIEQLTREYKALQYIDRLQSLNINMTVEEFYCCDINSLMVRLRKNYTGNPQAVDLCTDLCLEKGNYEISMWKSLLQQMIQLNMVDKLSQTLTTTVDQTQLWTLDVYKQAWQLVASKAAGNTGYEIALSSCPVHRWIQI